jgi:ribosome biogenesis GTPase
MKSKGKITKILANFYYVQDGENKLWECFARARLLKEGKLLFVGDEVDIEISNPKQGVIIDVYPRKNKLFKPPISNVDEVLVVFSTCEPEFDFYNLDRYLSYISYELKDEKISVCINKIDLKRIHIDEIYKNTEHKIFYVSALTEEGIEKLCNEISGKTIVLAGPSGVGKTSLIKAISPEKDLVIGEISSVGSGKHTTRNVQLISVFNNDKQSFIADTPGFTQFSFGTLKPERILNTFKDLSIIHCLYDNCIHNAEEGCLAEEMINKGQVSQSRYESYLKILEESKSEIKYGKKQETKLKSVGTDTAAGEVKGGVKFVPKIDQEKRAESRRKQKQDLLKIKDFDEEK